MVSEMVQSDVKALDWIVKKNYQFDLKYKKIWVAGHNGMVGKAILKNLTRNNLKVITVLNGSIL